MLWRDLSTSRVMTWYNMIFHMTLLPTFSHHPENVTAQANNAATVEIPVYVAAEIQLSVWVDHIGHIITLEVSRYFRNLDWCHLVIIDNIKSLITGEIRKKMSIVSTEPADSVATLSVGASSGYWWACNNARYQGAWGARPATWMFKFYKTIRPQ